MGKRLITAADIREAAQAGRRTLCTPCDECILTPMARDEATALGISLTDETGKGLLDPPQGLMLETEKVIREVTDLLKSRLPEDVSVDSVESIVRDIVEAKLSSKTYQSTPGSIQPANAAHGIRIINSQLLAEQKDGSVSIAEKASVKNAIGSETGDKLTGGYMVWEKATFNRRVERPEIAVVMEGELHLNVSGTSLIGRPGDMVYFPRGVVVDYSTPSRVKLACVNCIE
ncbi:MAG: hypothetical protein JRE21_03725 [Deltaproteobacteria bacterium]|jgi:ethanolamine utilization protein EutQ|nr:hypothetical protein [Deltaproteobacteria bacterium]